MNCEYCGKKFKLPKSKVKEGRRFCSRNCANLWMSESGIFKGKNSPTWKGCTINQTCLNCGKQFTTKKSTIAKGHGNFCSRDCFNEWQTEPRVELICKQCVNAFIAKPGEIRRGRKFCSFECYGAWVAGENHPFWLGGKSEEAYPKEFNATFKQFIRERDGYTCLLCGEYGDHCHHIDYDKDNLKPSNFVTLCLLCHAKTNFNRDYWPHHLRTLFLKQKKEKAKRIEDLPQYEYGVLSNDGWYVG